jgi:hypothetical protein
MDKWQALQTFWASFDLEAIDNTILLDNETREELGIAFPYITYEASLSDFDEPLALTASLWYHSLSWGAISQKADELGNALGLGGVKVPYDGGQIWIQRGTPFAQRMSDPDRYIRRIVLNIVIEFL